MGLSRYIFGTLILIVSIAGYVFSIESGDYKVVMGGEIILLPITIWVVAPAVLLFLLTVTHLIFYSIRQYFINKGIIEDKNLIINLIKHNLSGSTANYRFNNKYFEEISNVIEKLDFNFPRTELKTQNESINNLCQKMGKISNGEHVSLDEFSLPKDSDLREKNNINKLKVDIKYCLEVLHNSTEYSEKLFRAALIQTIETKNIDNIRKLLENTNLNKEMTLELLTLDSLCVDKDLALKKEEISELISKIRYELTDLDYINIAKMYNVSRMSPDEVISLFENLSCMTITKKDLDQEAGKDVIVKANEGATKAYLYVLFEYEMLDKVEEIVKDAGEDDYIPYRVLLNLKKEQGKNYTFDSLCYLK
jgi:hypothetical protein